jgi:hypothetical protein
VISTWCLHEDWYGADRSMGNLVYVDQGSFFGIRIHFLASEGGSLHKYTNQSQSLRILQPEKRTLQQIGLENCSENLIIPWFICVKRKEKRKLQWKRHGTTGTVHSWQIELPFGTTAHHSTLIELNIHLIFTFLNHLFHLYKFF